MNGGCLTSEREHAKQTVDRLRGKASGVGGME
jgi:hypothetical protein